MTTDSDFAGHFFESSCGAIGRIMSDESGLFDYVLIAGGEETAVDLDYQHAVSRCGRPCVRVFFSGHGGRIAGWVHRSNPRRPMVD